MSARGVDATQAQALLKQGYLYLDVRTVQEFALGHAPGAFSVPVQHAEGDTLVHNPRFLEVAQRAFPLDAALIVGCHASGRSERACDLLCAAGYQSVLRLDNGWDGRRDPFGRVLPGWSRLGLPTEQGDGGERSYRTLLQRVTAADR